MDWIHCNSCFNQLNEDGTKLKFLLTSCGHIFCEKCGCFADGIPDCCKFCKNACSTTPIGKESFQMNQQVSEYFQEPEEICEKLFNVVKFQRVHRSKLIGHHQRILSKYNRAKTYIKRLEYELQILKNALRKTPQNQMNNVKTTQSFAAPICHSVSNSTPFKMINADSKIRSVPTKKQKMFDFMKHRKQLFRNELSLSSSGSVASGSSVYASPLKENHDEKCMPPIVNLRLGIANRK